MKKHAYLAILALAAALAGTVALAGDHHHATKTLKEVMIGLGTEMTHLQEALWIEDLDKVKAAATAIAEHPHVGPAEKARIQGILGSGFTEFVQADRRVHDAAVRLAAAAEKRDVDEVVKELAEVQAGCVACHTSLRKRLTAP